MIVQSTWKTAPEPIRIGQQTILRRRNLKSFPMYIYVPRRLLIRRQPIFFFAKKHLDNNVVDVATVCRYVSNDHKSDQFYRISCVSPSVLGPVHTSLIMAKGLRSKCKRAARSELRKVLTIPIIKKQTERVALKLQDGLKQKNKSTSILSLRKVLVARNKNAGKGKGTSLANGLAQAMAGKEEKDAGDDDDADEMDAEDEGEEGQQSNKQKSKEEFVKRKGSKPRNNPGKEMVWF